MAKKFSGHVALPVEVIQEILDRPKDVMHVLDPSTKARIAVIVPGSLYEELVEALDRVEALLDRLKDEGVI